MKPGETLVHRIIQQRLLIDRVDSIPEPASMWRVQKVDACKSGVCWTVYITEVRPTTNHHHAISSVRTVHVFHQAHVHHLAMPKFLQHTLTIPIHVASLPRSYRPDTAILTSGATAPETLTVIDTYNTPCKCWFCTGSVISVCSTRVSTATCREIRMHTSLLR